MGVSAIGSLRAKANGPLRSNPAASSFPAICWEVISAMAVPWRLRPRLARDAADLRTGVEGCSLVAGRCACVDRGTACLGEFEVSTRRALDVPALTDSELDQGAQPLVAPGQLMGASHGASRYQEGTVRGRRPGRICPSTAGTIRWRGRGCRRDPGTGRAAPAGSAGRSPTRGERG